MAVFYKPTVTRVSEAKPLCTSFLLCDVTSCCLIWQATFMKTGHIHMGDNGQFSFHCVLEEEAAEQRHLLHQHPPGSHRKLDPDAVAFSIILLPAGTWRGVPSTYRYQEILSSLEPPSRFCMGIHAELYLPTFRLSMFCLYSPN